VHRTLDKAAGIIAHIMALAFASLFVITASLALLLFNLERHLLNPETYKRALIQQRVYERLPALIASEITASSRAGNYGWFNQAELQATLTAILTPAWLQVQTEGAIDQFNAYLTSNGSPAITFSLAEPQARLAGQDGVNLILQVIRSWPPCTEADLLVWAAFLSNSNSGDLPLCSPPEDVLSMATPLLQEAALQMAYSLPAELTLNLAPHADQPDVRPAIRLARMMAYVSLCLPMVCLIGTAMFGVRSAHDLLRWWGFPLSIAGLSGVVTAGLLVLSMRWAASTYVSPLLSDLPASLVQVVLDTLGYVLREAALWMGGEALTIGALGLAMVIGALIFKPSRSSGRGSPA
jgi:hypothetical protein